MNNTIKKANIEDILFFDIETVRGSEELIVDSKEYDLYEWKTRNKETDEVLPQKELIDHYKSKAALYPTFSKVVCISLGYVIDNKMVIMSITGKEQDVIMEFLAIYSKPKKTPILCGWNIIGFDLPTLRKRGFASGIGSWSLGKANDSGNKPWTLAEAVFDLMDVYKGTSFYNESLDEACFMLNVPSPKDKINGSQVSEEFYKNGVDNISEYCKKDVIACIQVFRRMRGEELLTEVIYKDNIVVEEKSMLEQVFDEGEISDPQKQQFKEVTEEAGLNLDKAGEVLTAAVGDKKSSVEL